jgi:hypothetical protein
MDRGFAETIERIQADARPDHQERSGSAEFGLKRTSVQKMRFQNHTSKAVMLLKTMEGDLQSR